MCSSMHRLWKKNKTHMKCKCIHTLLCLMSIHPYFSNKNLKLNSWNNKFCRGKEVSRTNKNYPKLQISETKRKKCLLRIPKGCSILSIKHIWLHRKYFCYLNRKWSHIHIHFCSLIKRIAKSPWWCRSLIISMHLRNFRKKINARMI